jgi:hypothetical protein
LICCPLCLVLSAEEVANAVKLMIDQSLTDRGSEVPAPFSSDDPSPEVIHCLASTHDLLDDDAFLSNEPRGIS